MCLSFKLGLKPPFKTSYLPSFLTSLPLSLPSSLPASFPPFLPYFPSSLLRRPPPYLTSLPPTILLPGNLWILLSYPKENDHILFPSLQVEKNQGLCQVLSLPAEHKSPVVSVDWSSSLSCYTCLTGSVDGSIQVTSLLKH